MMKGKLGLPLMADDVRIEELENIIAAIMRYVDMWLFGDDFTRDEVSRAVIMCDNVMKIMNEKDKRIRELEAQVKNLEYIAFGKE